MKRELVPISRAKTKLLELTRRVQEEGRAYLLTKDGEPVSALVPIEDYQALVDTIEVLAKATGIIASPVVLARALSEEAAQQGAAV